MFQFSLLFPLLVTVIAGRNFDITDPGWVPAWESIIDELATFSECVLACELTSNCVGGRYEANTRRCHLTQRTDTRQLMMYKRGSADDAQVFGVQCDPKTGFYEQNGKVIYGEDEVEKPSMTMEACITLCSQYFWCRSVDFRLIGSTCYLQAVDNSSVVTDSQFNFRNRNC